LENRSLGGLVTNHNSIMGTKKLVLGGKLSCHEKSNFISARKHINNDTKD